MQYYTAIPHALREKVRETWASLTMVVYREASQTCHWHALFAKLAFPVETDRNSHQSTLVDIFEWHIRPHPCPDKKVQLCPTHIYSANIHIFETPVNNRELSFYMDGVERFGLSTLQRKHLSRHCSCQFLSNNLNENRVSLYLSLSLALSLSLCSWLVSSHFVSFIRWILL